MPYKNMPQSMWGKMDKCVSEVQGKGNDKKSAIAICYTSMMTGKEIAETMKSFKLKDAPNYRVTQKSIMDAPNLRGDDLQRCLNCKYAQAIVTDDMTMPMATDMPMQNTTMMETQKDMCADLICTQFDFMTEPDFVCDGYEAIPPELVTMKQSDGKYRWFMYSSSSYEDRDGQIISQKALEEDTARMNETGEFGGIGWWHLWILDGKPVNFKELSDDEKMRAHPWMFGRCDFSQMHGRISIESGTFDDDWLGEMFATQKGLGASREFFNPPPENGVFNKIMTFSRAILPEPHASNRLTLFGVSAKEKNMDALDKFKDLIKKAGNTPEAKEKVEGLLKGAEALDKTAEQVLTSKETAKEEAPATSPEPEKKTVFMGDMTMEEFDAKLTATVEKFLTPAVKEIGAQVAKMNETQTLTAKEQGEKVATSIKSVQDMQTDLAARLAALEGLKPRGYSPTQDPNTKVDPVTVKEKTPKGDKPIKQNNIGEWLYEDVPAR